MVLLVSTSNAAGKMGLSVGGDVLIPMGTFGDIVSTGFGGSVRGELAVNPNFAVGITTGYFVWSGKDNTSGSVTVSGADFKGVPLRAYGKFYAAPEGQTRMYGIFELGLFFSSTTASGTVAGQSYSVSGSSTDFNYAPGVGVEMPLGQGTTALDLSVRYDGIATSGSSSGSIGIRAAVNFGLGN
jgi:hypothetical protein